MPDFSPLTAREREVLRWLVQGLTPQEIAVRLGTAKGTVGVQLRSIRKKLGARTNAQASVIAAWYYSALLKDCMVKHGTLAALDWHEQHEVPLCEPCGDIVRAQEARVKMPRKRRRPTGAYRRLTPVQDHAKPGEPVKCGTMPAARRHIAKGERIHDLVCGCREAYRQWWQDYSAQRGALGA